MTLAKLPPTNLHKYSTQIAVAIAAIATLSSNFSPQVLVSVSSLGFLAYAERQRHQAIQVASQKTLEHTQRIAQQELQNLQQQLQTANHQLRVLHNNLSAQQQTDQRQAAERQKLQQQLLTRQQEQQQLQILAQPLIALRDRLAVVKAFNQTSETENQIQPQPAAASSPFSREHPGRIAIFVDGENLRIASEGLGCRIKPSKLRAYIRDRSGGEGEPEDYYYKTHQPGRKYDDRHELEAGFRVIRKEQVRQPADKEGKPQWKGNQDVELACNMLTLAILGEFDTAVLVAGDRDYIPVVQILQRLGCRVELLFWEKGSEGYAQTPQDLIKAVGADNFTPLEAIKAKVIFPRLAIANNVLIFPEQEGEVRP